MIKYVDFLDLTGTQRLQVMQARPRTPPRELAKLAFKVLEDGNVSPNLEHCRLTRAYEDDPYQIMRDSIESHEDMSRRFKSCDFTMAPERKP